MNKKIFPKVKCDDCGKKTDLFIGYKGKNLCEKCWHKPEFTIESVTYRISPLVAVTIPIQHQ
ncbi:MAG: hypothetical protein QMC67_05365 [Candidatus Wallbacteria bacterium]